MDNQTRQTLIKKLLQVDLSQRPVNLTHRGAPVLTILPVKDQREFAAAQTRKLNQLKEEMHGILTLIRSRLQRHRIEDIEAQLAEYRRKIQQEQGSS